MDQRLSIVTLGVENLPASRAFYSGGLGWTPSLDLDEVVFYQVGGGVLLGLFGSDALGDDVGVPVQRGTSFTLACNLDSPDAVVAAVERARRAGASVLKEPGPAVFGGVHAYFADPDGHRWEVAHNPGWSVAPDGTVTIGDAP